MRVISKLNAQCEFNLKLQDDFLHAFFKSRNRNACGSFHTLFCPLYEVHSHTFTFELMLYIDKSALLHTLDFIIKIHEILVVAETTNKLSV